MLYEINSKADFQSGTALTVRIPEEETDKKALYTILEEKPDFILPFRHRAIDGQVEFIYQAGSRSKLAYLSGSRSPCEYADLWTDVIRPLLDCGDWFMDPYSFLLKHEYIYCDKNGKSVSFVYIPSTRACSDHNSLKSMVTAIARQNHVTDVNFENEVVWAIQDFDPGEFLRMVKAHKSRPAQAPPPQNQPVKPEQPAPAEPEAAPLVPAAPPPPAAASVPVIENMAPETQTGADEIAIDFSFADGNGKTPKEKQKPKTGLLGFIRDFINKRKKARQEIFVQVEDEGLGAVPEPECADPPVACEAPEPVDTDGDDTQLDIQETAEPKFRYAGSGGHPGVIRIDAGEGGIFIIGRFDAAAAIKQCGFEFDKKTKAVSRRHAAVEKGPEGYCIVDLDSAAGTFINGQKLPPNAPFALTNGCRVSFGHSGADYIWEE